MAMEEKIEKIEKLSGSSKSRAGKSLVDAQLELERVPPNKEKFDALVRVERTAPEQIAIEKEPRNSLISEISDINSRVDVVKRKTPAEIVSQTKDIIAQIDDIKGRLNKDDLKLDSKTENAMQNRLTHIDEKLQMALSKVGVEYEPTELTSNKTLMTPIDRFLGFLADGQHRLSQIGNEVASFHANKGEIRPADMLYMQIKVGFIQQELELFSSLLNKALESTKTIMNVQV